MASLYVNTKVNLSIISKNQEECLSFKNNCFFVLILVISTTQ